MKTTLRQIDKSLEDVAKGHLQIADYFWGDYADFFDEPDRKYPALIANVSANIPFSKVTSVPLNLIVIDQVDRGNINLKDVESDTLQIGHDVYRILKHSPNWKLFCAVQQAGSDLKFKDSSVDEVAGWRIPVTLKLIESTGLCDMPIEDYDINKKIKC